MKLIFLLEFSSESSLLFCTVPFFAMLCNPRLRVGSKGLHAQPMKLFLSYNQCQLVVISDMRIQSHICEQLDYYYELIVIIWEGLTDRNDDAAVKALKLVVLLSVLHWRSWSVRFPAAVEPLGVLLLLISQKSKIIHLITAHNLIWVLKRNLIAVTNPSPAHTIYTSRSLLLLLKCCFCLLLNGHNRINNTEQ